MCDKIILENSFMLKYCLDKYITQKFGIFGLEFPKAIVIFKINTFKFF